MAREVLEFAVSVPAGTPLATPAATVLPMPARIVRRVRVRVPPGPNGLMGFALASGGVNVIPWGAGQWFVANDESFTWDLEGQITSGAWQLRAYNTGAYAHTVYLTFELDPPQVASSVALGPSPVFVSPVDLSSSPAGDPGSSLPPPPPGPEPPPPVVTDDGYAMARDNAIAALEAALGGELTVEPVPPPTAGTVTASEYDAGRAAALAALLELAAAQ